MSFSLPSVPATHKDFVPYLASQPNTPLKDLVKPYNEFEARLRQGFAQYRDHPSVQDAHVNAVPIFTGDEHTLNIRARNPEDDAEAERYIMPLKPRARRIDGSPAMVRSLKEFKENFDLFSERSLVDMDWDNVVVAGSSVVTAMLPVAERHGASKRALREYYHQKLAPSSDVDIFLWGLDEHAAIAKIAQIEECVRNSILAETTTIRTKNAITIASQYPTRHIQIVLRLYKSVSEILTGFDVDCSCFAFDGKQVYATPRGITSFCSQINTIDLSRRSPSYESRLAKYAHRGFEIYFADLDRKRIDPTLYDRSFVRTMGLARLLMLERLPKESDREAYLNQRRKERGRPLLDLWRNKKGQLPGNMKDKDPEDVAEWDLEADVSNYHTFTVPYGPKYHAKKIEKLLYVKDMLLNAEWNHKKDRTVNLHRHPCFVGDIAHVVNDCCGECPEPKSDEELEVAEEERKVYVHGKISFMKDDPGRQAIGSFHPLTAEDWTDMAYLGNTQELCTAIINHDADAVIAWCSQEGNDVNKRDHTGRTPLQLAVLSGNIDAMRVLIDNGARIIARIADGFTALHMAAAVGRADMIRLLAAKSDKNEELEAEKQDARKAERQRQKAESSGDTQMTEATADEDENENEDAEMIDAEGTEEEEDTMTQGSFVKVKGNDIEAQGIVAEGKDDMYGPDVYDVNVLAWDAAVSPLHVAILAGQTDAIEALVTDFGADVLLPVKLKNTYNGEVNSAILNLTMASMSYDPQESSAVTRRLIRLGAKPSQSDMNEASGLHGAVILDNVEALKVMIEEDMPASKTAINHVSWTGNRHGWDFQVHSPLLSAVRKGNTALVNLLLEAGAAPTVTYEAFRDAYLRSLDAEPSHMRNVDEQNIRTKYKTNCEQPIVSAAATANIDIIKALLDNGADVNAIDMNGGRVLEGESNWNNQQGKTALDIINEQIKSCNQHQSMPVKRNAPLLRDNEEYLRDLKPGTYRHIMTSRNLELAKLVMEKIDAEYAESCKNYEDMLEKQRQEPLVELEELEEVASEVSRRGGKCFNDLYPNKNPPLQTNNYAQNSNQNNNDNEEVESPYYEIDLTFRDPRMDDKKKAAYFKLFDAVWEGDAETIRNLTLKPIDDGSGETIPPIAIAVFDNFVMNPLGIAIAKGNLQLAQIILDIAAAQFQPDKESRGDEAPKRRFRIRGPEDEVEDEDGSEDGDMADVIPVTSELIDDKFTIDDLGQLSKTVGSTVDPKTFLTWHCPVWMANTDLTTTFRDASLKYNENWSPKLYYQGTNTPYKKQFAAWINGSYSSTSLLDYSVTTGDLEATKFLMNASKAFAPKDGENGAENILKLGCWPLWQLHGLLATSVRKNKLDIAEVLITESGAGMPIDELAKEVDIPEDEREKPKYYQGLKLYGQHKAAWARQAAGEHGQETVDWRKQSPAPFLKAIYFGNMSSIEFWQSDACIRMYEAFGQKNREVKEVQLLARKYGNWSNFVTQWLGLRRDLALHCAVARGGRADQKFEVIETTKYLMTTVPRSLNTKSVSGKDPLWLAFYNHQTENAKLFIEAGADQNTRDSSGMNIIHALLSSPAVLPKALTSTLSDSEEKAIHERLAKMEEMLKLVDTRILSALWTDRCSKGPSGLTPFAQLVDACPPSIECFNLLDKYMPTAEVLTMFDGSGQTPVHRMVINAQNVANRRLLRTILTTYPELLALENAAGQTPLDLASTFYIRDRTSQAPFAPFAAVPGMFMNSYITNHKRLMRRGKNNPLPPAHDADADDDSKPWQTVLYRLLKGMTETHMSKHGLVALKRRMINVRDASEVAKRLAEQQSKPATEQVPYYHRSFMGRRGRRRAAKKGDFMDEDEPVEELHDEIDRWIDGGD